MIFGQLLIVQHFAVSQMANSLDIFWAPQMVGLASGSGSPTMRTVAKPCISARADSSQAHTSLRLSLCMVAFSPCGTSSAPSSLASAILLPTLNFCRMDQFVASSRAGTSIRLETRRPRCKLLHLIASFCFTSWLCHSVPASECTAQKQTQTAGATSNVSPYWVCQLL
jgi:hypothetical protein